MVDVAILNHPLSGLKVLQRHSMSVRALGIKPAKGRALKFSCERTRVRKSRRADSDANVRCRELLRFV